MRSAQSDPPSAVSNVARAAVAVSMSVFLLGLFVVGVNYYSTTIFQIENHPLVTNLNSQGFLTRVYFGASPCEGDAPACFSSPKFDDSMWSTVKVPQVNLQNFPGYDHSHERGDIWYRFHVPVTDEQLASTEELAFTPIYVFHQRFRIWVDGRLVDAVSAGAQSSSVVKVPLPRENLLDRVAIVTIKASVSPAERGISHLRSLYVGPRSIIEQVHVLRERSVLTYFLLFLATKGSIFVVFTLFFLFGAEKRALFSFLIYSFFVTVENLLAGDFLAPYLELRYRYALYFGGKMAAIAALGTFAAIYVQAFRARGLLRRWHQVASLLVGLSVGEVVITNNSGWVTTKLLFHLTNTILVIGLGISLGLALLSLRQWRRAGADGRRSTNLKIFIGVLASYLSLLIWEFLGNQFVGFDKRAVFDLLFFFYMAFTTAKEFGFNQGQVVTLEGHMAEKQRMEAELQEAALIAKAFVPGEAPAWGFCEMEVFHRPLTEASGDWYTFETGPSGRYMHIILCDITGHGVQAALVVSTCRTVLSTLESEHPEVADSSDFLLRYATSLNKILVRQGGGFHVTTMLGLTIDSEEQTLFYMTAGHPLPLHITKSHGESDAIRALVSRGGPLGVDATSHWELSRTKLSPGDEIIAFTDGLPAHAGIRGVKQYLRARPQGCRLSPEDLFNALVASEKSRSRNVADDDVSIIWLRWVGGELTRQATG